MAPRADTITTPLASVGIGIGKDVFHVVAFGTDGKIAFRWKIKRLSLADAFKKLPPSIVGMEACLSAHFVSRTLRALGRCCGDRQPASRGWFEGPAPSCP